MDTKSLLFIMLPAFCEDPETAWASSFNVRIWDSLFYLSFGVVITVSVDIDGVLIVFVFPVAPAILALIGNRLGKHYQGSELHAECANERQTEASLDPGEQVEHRRYSRGR